jgi:hypothetical protein
VRRRGRDGERSAAGDREQGKGGGEKKRRRGERYEEGVRKEDEKRRSKIGVGISVWKCEMYE